MFYRKIPPKGETTRVRVHFEMTRPNDDDIDLQIERFLRAEKEEKDKDSKPYHLLDTLHQEKARSSIHLQEKTLNKATSYSQHSLQKPDGLQFKKNHF